MTTKKFLFIFFTTFIFGLSNLQAQKPQKIKGIAKEVKSISYYQEQSALWNKLIKEDPKNTEAWHYYYKAERATLQLQKPEIWPNQKEKFFAELNPILEKARQHIDGTFEYHYLFGLNSSDEASIQSLKKAYAIDSDRSEIYGWLMTYYLPLLEEDKLTDLAEKMLKSNIYSNANLMWNYNALQSIDQNGVILTNGDMDSLPKWVLQYGAKIRPDVLVVNKWFLAFENEYRRKIFKELDMAPLSKKESDFENLDDYVDYVTVESLKNCKRPIYTSSGTPKEFLKHHNLEDKMYLVGNALKYSEEKFNNTAVIKKNIEEKYVLDYLLNNFQIHEEDEVVKTQMNLTYLPSLIHLRKYYESKNEKGSVQKCNSLIDRIATDSGRKKEVLSWFEN